MSQDDICEICGNELKVTGSRVICEGDDSPDTKTRVFTVQEMRENGMNRILTLEKKQFESWEKGKKKEIFVEQKLSAK